MKFILQSIFRLVILFLMLSNCATAYAQSRNSDNTLRLDSESAMPRAQIEDVAWLEGHWQAETQGGVAEVIWSPPRAGTMMGMYKLVRGDSIAFYEFRALVEDRNSLFLKLKHFNADLTGWEAKEIVQAFPLVKVKENEIYFEGFTMRRIQTDVMQLFVTVKMKDQTIHEIEVQYHRLK